MAEVEETLNRIKTHKGVRGVIVLGGDGAILRSSFDAAQTTAYAGAASQLTERARSLIRDLDPQDLRRNTVLLMGASEGFSSYLTLRQQLLIEERRDVFAGAFKEA
ncbi:hypothetical protein Emag_002324 [Eimeria magna]